MALRMVIEGSDQDRDEQKRTLEEAFLKYLGKLRGFHVEKSRRGQRPQKLLQRFEFETESDASAADQARELCDAAMKIVHDDAADSPSKLKYFVVLLGEPLTTKEPELVRVPVIVEAEEHVPPTRETELVRSLAQANDFNTNLAKLFLEFVKAAPSMVNANAKTAAELGAALATATVTSHEWEYKKAGLEVDARIRLEEVRGRVERSGRMWDTFEHFFNELSPYFDIAAAEFAAAGGTKTGGSHTRGGPSKDEIDAVFGSADPDLGKLAHSFMAATSHEAEALKQALIARFDALNDDAKREVMAAFTKLDHKRQLTLGYWMKRNGIGQRPSGK